MIEGMTRSAAVLTTCTVIALAACSESTGPERGTERVGVVEWVASVEASEPTWPTVGQAVIEAPTTVQAGEPFVVVVWTVGSSGCWEPVGMEASTTANTAQLVPIDRDRMNEGLACTAVIVELRHETELVFEQAGTATIRVEGRRVVGEDFTTGEDAVVEHTVTVVD